MNRTQLQQLNPEHILFKYQKLQLKLDEQKKEFQKEKEKENEDSEEPDNPVRCKWGANKSQKANFADLFLFGLFLLGL